jgi:chromate transport protein ChrA
MSLALGIVIAALIFVSPAIIVTGFMLWAYHKETQCQKGNGE